MDEGREKKSAEPAKDIFDAAYNAFRLKEIMKIWLGPPQEDYANRCFSLLKIGVVYGKVS